MKYLCCIHIEYAVALIRDLRGAMYDGVPILVYCIHKEYTLTLKRDLRGANMV